jgi:phage tail sheath protein FI
MAEYEAAANRALDEAEVALLAFPDLWTDLGDEEGSSLLGQVARRADVLLDRMILTELPPEAGRSAAAAGQKVEGLLDEMGERTARAVAVYHPWLVVEGEGPGATRPLPPCGHVAGLASRLDRERGPSRTPATRPLIGVVDVAGSLQADALAALYTRHVNPITCRPGRGLQVLGGRTLSRRPDGRYIAHRRLVHRLVRAIRRVAEPLVFEPNGPDVWQALRRAATTVLLEAFRSGALHGTTPTQAFSVVCDATTTTEDEMALGRAICEIGFAPADPIEWIRILVTTTPEGALEVVEA